MLEEEQNNKLISLDIELERCVRCHTSDCACEDIHEDVEKEMIQEANRLAVNIN